MDVHRERVKGGLRGGCAVEKKGRQSKGSVSVGKGASADVSSKGVFWMYSVPLEKGEEEV